MLFAVPIAPCNDHASVGSRDGLIIWIPFIRIDQPERFVGIVLEAVHSRLYDRFASLQRGDSLSHIVIAQSLS